MRARRASCSSRMADAISSVLSSPRSTSPETRKFAAKKPLLLFRLRPRTFVIPRRVRHGACGRALLSPHLVRVVPFILPLLRVDGVLVRAPSPRRRRPRLGFHRAMDHGPRRRLFLSFPLLAHQIKTGVNRFSSSLMVFPTCEPSFWRRIIPSPFSLVAGRDTVLEPTQRRPHEGRPATLSFSHPIHRQSASRATCARTPSYTFAMRFLFSWQPPRTHSSHSWRAKDLFGAIASVPACSVPFSNVTKRRLVPYCGRPPGPTRIALPHPQKKIVFFFRDQLAIRPWVRIHFLHDPHFVSIRALPLAFPIFILSLHLSACQHLLRGSPSPPRRPLVK